VDIDIRSLGEVKVIKLRGKLSLGEAVDRLRADLYELMGNGETRIVLDLSEVPMIDSSGIGLLVKVLTTSKQSGGSIKLLTPSKFVIQTLKMIGLLNLFDVFEDSQQAIASFGEA
jgi:anti-sigma B factor antagonist